MRVGMKVGPFYVSSSTRRRRRPTRAPLPTRVQLAAQAKQRAAKAERLRVARAERHARYGPTTVADPRTWHTVHTIAAIVALGVAIELPSMLGDGTTSQTIWAIAVVGGLVAWMVWLRRVDVAQRNAGIASRRRDVVRQARAVQDAAYAHAQYLAPRQVGNAWNHGECHINHRTPEAARRCDKGGL